jgi:cation diffusion facilitator family transporter
MQQYNKGIEATLRSILVNIILVVVKGIAGIFGNSYALIADAIESMSDVLSSLVVWLGLKVSAKEPDEDHPYGHGKAEPLATIVVAIALLVFAIIIAVESLKQIMHPHQLPKLYTIFVLAGVIIVKEFMFRYSSSVGTEIGSSAVKADAWHHRSDAISSLVAMVGISVAIIGGKGYESADDWAALLASVIIVYNSYQIFRPAFDEIMDMAPSTELVKEIRIIAGNVTDVSGIEKCFIRKMGLYYYVDIHVMVNGHFSVKHGHDIAHKVKDEIKLHKKMVYDVLVHIEPVEEHN